MIYLISICKLLCSCLDLLQNYIQVDLPPDSGYEGVIKEVEINQFGEAGGMQPNEPHQTDRCFDGGMKINDSNLMILSEEDGMKVRFCYL